MLCVCVYVCVCVCGCSGTRGQHSVSAWGTPRAPLPPRGARVTYTKPVTPSHRAASKPLSAVTSSDADADVSPPPQPEQQHRADPPPMTTTDAAPASTYLSELYVEVCARASSPPYRSPTHPRA